MGVCCGAQRDRYPAWNGGRQKNLCEVPQDHCAGGGRVQRTAHVLSRSELCQTQLWRGLSMLNRAGYGRDLRPSTAVLSLVATSTVTKALPCDTYGRVSR